MPDICYLPPDTQATGPFTVFSRHAPTQAPSPSPTAPVGLSLTLDTLARKAVLWLALIFMLSCLDLVVASPAPSFPL